MTELPVDEGELAEVLEEYLRILHEQGTVDASNWASVHPQLAPWLECIDALESLAVLPASAFPEEAVDLATTVTLIPPDCVNTVAHDQRADHSEAALPRAFGRFHLIEELGRGGMGVVFRAHDPDLGRDVAIKMILASHLADDIQVARFQVEARAAAKLRHANVVAIHEVGRIFGQHYFCMDYVVGHNLAERIRQGPMEPEIAAELVCRIAEAVDYLHRKGVVHRDLKPSNILLDETGQPFVTDFGLAKFFQGDSHLTQPGTIAGTPSYMAPEQAAGQTERVGVPSDIYSLGAILYELLTGVPPFRERSALDTLVQVIEGDPVPPRARNPHVPLDLQRICLHCLEKSPQDRYSTAEELAEDLRRHLKSEDLSIVERNWYRRTGLWARRKPALASRLVMFGLFAIILQANYHWNGESEYIGYHVTVMAILFAGGLGSFVFQTLLDNPRWTACGRVGWAVFDWAIVTGSLFVVVSQDYLSGPLLIAYPLLIVGSGLWFRESIVGMVTVGSLFSYGLLVAWCHAEIDRPHHHALYAIGLGLLGFMVAYQVRRVRALSQFYDRRGLP